MRDRLSGLGICQKRNITLGIILLTTGLQNLWVYYHQIKLRGDYGWDSAAHAMWGVTIYQDLISGRWLSLLFDTYRQVYWPFMHSWFLAGSMLFLGPKEEALRLVSLAAFGFTAFVLGLSAWKYAIGSRWLSATVTVALWLTATEFVTWFAADVVIESLAIAMTGITIWFIARSAEGGDPNIWIFAGIFGMLTYFTKTDYGIIVLMASIVEMATQSRSEARFLFKRKLFSFLTPVISMGVIWFAYLPKIPATISALVNRPQGPYQFSIAGLLYHFKMLAHWCGSPWLLILFGFCFIFAIVWDWKLPLIRILVIYTSIALVLHSLSQTKDSKHITKLLPWILLIMGLQAGKAWTISAKKKIGPVIKIGFLSILIGFGIIRLQSFLSETAQPPMSNLENVRQDILSRINSNRSHLMLGTFGELSPDLIRWKLFMARHDCIFEPLDDKKLKFMKIIHSLKKKFPIAAFLEKEKSELVWRVNFPSKKSLSTKISPIEAMYCLIQSEQPERILVIEMSPYSAWSSDDYQKYHVNGGSFLPVLSHFPGYKQTDKVSYLDKGINLLVFDLDLK